MESVSSSWLPIAPPASGPDQSQRDRAGRDARDPRQAGRAMRRRGRPPFPRPRPPRSRSSRRCPAAPRRSSARRPSELPSAGPEDWALAGDRAAESSVGNAGRPEGVDNLERMRNSVGRRQRLPAWSCLLSCKPRRCRVNEQAGCHALGTAVAPPLHLLSIVKPRGTGRLALRRPRPT